MTLRGAIYGSVLYSQATYGRPGSSDANPVYSAAPLVATPLDYYTLRLTWDIPTAGQTLQLVRNNYSLPSDPNDGAVVLSQGIYASALYVDAQFSITQQGMFQYYTLWNQDSGGTWWRAADCQAMLPKNWGYGARLFSLLPGYYQDWDQRLATVLALTGPGAPGGTAQAVSTAVGSLDVAQVVGGETGATSGAEVNETEEGTAEAASATSSRMQNLAQLESLFQAQGESTTYGSIGSYEEEE